jgi:hypothetical protein
MPLSKGVESNLVLWQCWMWHIALMVWTPMLSISANASVSGWFPMSIFWQLFKNGGAEIEWQIYSMNIKFGYQPSEGKGSPSTDANASQKWIAQNSLIVHQNGPVELPNFGVLYTPSLDKAE